MNLKEKISNDFKEAFKNKEMEKKTLLSSLISEIKNKEIELGSREKGLSDEEALKVIKKALKQREDAKEQYQSAGRDDLAQKEAAEAVILKEYLPEEMGEEEVRAIVKKVIEEVGAQSMADMGKIMPKAMQELQGRADGSKVKAIVEEQLK